MSPPSPDLLMLVEGALDATSVVNEQLELLAFNRPFTEAMGMSPHVLRAQPRHGLCHERLALASCQPECVALRALRLGRPLREHQVAGGDDRFWIATAVPLLQPSGERLILQTYRDVTAETHMQERFKKLLQWERHQNDRLQEEVQRRTLELTRTRDHLIQMDKMSSLGLIVAGVAHEINNPIHFIMGNIEFVESHSRALLALLDAARELLPVESRQRFSTLCQRSDLEYIRQDFPKLVAAFRAGTERVVNIVNDLRIFSHAGPPDAANSNVVPGFLTTLGLVEPEARKRRIRLHRELSDLPSIECNPSQLNQVLMNLVVNAIQSAPEGGNVWVRAGAEGNRVRLEVEDDGPGIPEALRTRIFDPFYTTKAVGKGTGLGLSISLGIVQAHQGELRVSSGQRGGALFIVELPRNQSQRRAETVTLVLNGP